MNLVQNQLEWIVEWSQVGLFHFLNGILNEQKHSVFRIPLFVFQSYSVHSRFKRFVMSCKSCVSTTGVVIINIFNMILTLVVVNARSDE